MKRLVLWTLVVGLSVSGLLSAQAADGKKTKGKAAAAKKTEAPVAEKAAEEATSGSLKTDNDKINYLFGFQTASQMKRMGIESAPSVFMQGMQDGMAEKTPVLSQEEAQQVISRMQANMQTKMQKEGAENLKAGEAFLEANKSKEGVKVTSSGLQYKVIKSGTGPTAKDGEEVEVKYRGTSC